MAHAESSGPIRILIVDDTPADRLLATRQIRQAVADAAVTEVGTEEQLEQAIAEPEFDLVITDFKLQWTSGLVVLDRVRAVMPNCPVIMFTDSGDEEIAVEAMRRGLDDYVPKNPKRSAPLSAAILRVMRRRHEQATIRALEQDRERVNEALRVSEKFAELGRLAGVVAHEINNPLESLVNLLYLVREDRTLPQHLRSYVQTCEAELARISTITRQTLTFYRESRSPELTEMGPLLDSILAMFAHKAMARVVVEREYKPVDPVLAYPSQLRQVFVNLISNALEAMGQRGGRLVVRIRPSHQWNGTKARGVRVSIGDTGSGIDPANRGRLFQAFFSTKGDSGTGLGLWVTHDIVERHGGTIHVYSTNQQRQHGTVFSVFLPYAPAMMKG